MTALNLLTRLGHQGIKRWVEQDQLHYQAPKNVFTRALRTKIAETEDLNNQSRHF